VACPCALALAAPFALGTAQRWLARAGVFLRNALVLERLARVDMVVFDKTGTLTTSDDRAVTFDGWHEAAPAGQPPGPGLPPPPAGLSEVEARWIASLARHSAHPHAVQLAEALADPRTLPRAAGFRETPGGGIEARIEGHEVWLGSQAWLESRGLRAGRSTGTPDAGTGSRGPVPAPGSQVWVAIDGRCRGVFTLANALRPEVEALVRELTGRYQLALLSGDHAWERARFRALFPDDAGLHFGQSPRDKLEFIARLQRSGRVVMMVGDGLNDAGALRQSDAGVAVVGHAGAFSPASDVILEAGQLPGVAQGLRLARRAVRTVRWSFVLSAAYNLVGVSVAAAGQLSPLVAAVLMPLSSLSVVVFACGATTRAALRMGVGGGVARVDGPRIPA
jgi:Cu+-exporting ATPase